MRIVDNFQMGIGRKILGCLTVFLAMSSALVSCDAKDSGNEEVRLGVIKSALEAPAILSPSPGSTLSSRDVTFSWETVAA